MTFLNGEWVPLVNLVEFVKAQRDWGYETFGPDYSGTLPHLKKEIAEIEDKPDDLEEWIDAILLGFSGACRSGDGHTAVEVVDALLAKFEKNKARTWPDWREVAAGEAIEHDRTGEPCRFEERSDPDGSWEVCVVHDSNYPCDAGTGEEQS